MSGVRPGEGVDVGDEGEQPRPIALRHPQQPALLVVESTHLLLEDELEVTHHGGEGGAQLVGGEGEELVLHPLEGVAVADVLEQQDGVERAALRVADHRRVQLDVDRGPVGPQVPLLEHLVRARTSAEPLDELEIGGGVVRVAEALEGHASERLLPVAGDVAESLVDLDEAARRLGIDVDQGDPDRRPLERVAEALLGLVQRLLRPHPVRDVDHGPEAAGHRPLRAPQRDRGDRSPGDDAVGTQEAVLGGELLALDQGARVLGHGALAVAGMDRRHPAVPPRRVGRDPGDPAPVLVDPQVVPLGIGLEDSDRDVGEDPAVAFVTGLEGRPRCRPGADIARDHRHEPLVPVPPGAEVELDGELAASRVAGPQLDHRAVRRAPPRGAQTGDRRRVRPAVLLRHELVDRPADRLLLRPAEEPRGGGVPRHDAVVEIQDDDGVGGGFDDRAQPGLAGPERALGHLARPEPAGDQVRATPLATGPQHAEGDDEHRQEQPGKAQQVCERRQCGADGRDRHDPATPPDHHGPVGAPHAGAPRAQRAARLGVDEGERRGRGKRRGDGALETGHREEDDGEPVEEPPSRHERRRRRAAPPDGDVDDGQRALVGERRDRGARARGARVAGCRQCPASTRIGARVELRATPAGPTGTRRR